jgi:elongation factor P
MSIPATQMRPGMIIKHNNELHAVFAVEHRTPGNLRAFIQAKLRNLRTGAMFEHRFRSPSSTTLRWSSTTPTATTTTS